MSETLIDYPGFGDLVYSPVCATCKHLDVEQAIDGKHACAAFELIPREIWVGENDHREPYKGDGGVQFEPMGGSNAQD